MQLVETLAGAVLATSGVLLTLSTLANIWKPIIRATVQAVRAMPSMISVR